jgi:predicted nucleotidyltransferase
MQETILQKVKSLVEKDPRFMGMWTVGSMATGKADKYSDLDLYLLVETSSYDQVYSERTSFAEKIGKILSTFEVDWPNCQLYGIILDDCVEVDMCYCKPENLEIFGPYKIVVDRKGNLQELLSKHTVSYETNMKKHLKEHIDFAAYNLLHAVNMLGRGEYWSSIRQIETLRKRIIGLIGLRTKTDVEEEYRKLESVVDNKLNESLQKTLCDYSVESIVQAVYATAALFKEEAENLCQKEDVPFPSDAFKRLLEYLAEIRLEKLGKS